VADRATLPDDLELVRVTDEFDESTVPRGLHRAHRVARGVWGVLVVRDGSLRFVWEDGSGTRVLVAGERQVIPPETPHRVEVIGPVRFVVEFHRPAARGAP
jgi:tellurite resistance-related uncharacterized protein